jgi:hypothetical protein
MADDVDKLPQLAAWYREFADRAGNPWSGRRDCARRKSWKRRPASEDAAR